MLVRLSDNGVEPYLFKHTRVNEKMAKVSDEPVDEERRKRKNINYRGSVC